MNSKHSFFMIAAVCATIFGADTAGAEDVSNPIATATGFAAKESCSCAFLAEQTDEYCKAFGQPGLVPIKITIDREAKTTTASVVVSKRTARYVEGIGCRLDL